MRARLPDLEGKYYATSIILTTDYGDDVEFSFYVRGDGTPSEREEFLREHPKEICDWHYETQATYEYAKRIVEAINSCESE